MADASPLAPDSPLAPGSPVPEATEPTLERMYHRLFGIGRERYQMFPEKVLRSLWDQLREGAQAGTEIVKRAESGAYGPPGTHEFTEKIIPNAFEAARKTYIPGEMAAFHASGKLSPLELTSAMEAGTVGKKAVSRALEPPLVDVGDIAPRAAGNEPAAAIPKLPEITAKETLHTISGPLTPEETAALKTFTAGGAWFANANLLKTKHPLKVDADQLAEGRALIPQLDAAFSKATLNKDITVYRGMKNVDLSSLKPFVGTDVPFHMPTYSSTSLDPGVAAGFASGKKGALWKITVPKGAKALDLRKHTHYPSEKEVVLPRGSRWKITKIEQHPQGKVPVIHAEVIP